MFVCAHEITFEIVFKSLDRSRKKIVKETKNHFHKSGL